MKAIGVGLGIGSAVIVSLVAILAIVVPAVTGSFVYTILTRSMEPGLPPGTLIVVRPTAAADLRVGDVVTYQLSPGKASVVTHRVVQVLIPADGVRRFVTQGDNNAVPDQAEVTTAQVRGRVWYALPWVGLAADLRSDTRTSAVAAFVGVGLIVYGVVSVAAWMRNRRKRPTTARPR